MFNLDETCKFSGDSQRDIEKLTNFGIQICEQLGVQRATIHQFRNGSVLLSKAGIAQIEDALLASRHLDAMFKEVLAAAKDYPGFERRFKQEFDAVYLDIENLAAPLRRISQPS